MGAVLVSSAVAWLVTREITPRQVRIAAGPEGYLYQQVARELKDHLQRRTGREVIVLQTAGSIENHRRLLSIDPAERVDLAILQGGAVQMDGLTVVAPLYPDVVQVIARSELGIKSLRDLQGRRIIIGVESSGMRASASEVLRHYGMEPEGPNCLFGGLDDLLADNSIDAAILTTGIGNNALNRALATGIFDLVPIDDAEALARKHYHFRPYKIPAGLYSESPRTPNADVPTVATTAFLAARQEAPALLVEETLEALYLGVGPWDFPDLIPREEALQWRPWALHPAARSFYDPFDHLGWTSTVLDTLSALKELFVALIAGGFLLWDRWRRLREKEAKEELRIQKDRLDAYLDQTAAIERNLMLTDDPAPLRALLDEVSLLKLRALSEFTHENLRGDTTFSLLLLQCSNLSSTIQLKIVVALVRLGPEERRAIPTLLDHSGKDNSGVSPATNSI